VKSRFGARIPAVPAEGHDQMRRLGTDRPDDCHPRINHRDFLQQFVRKVGASVIYEYELVIAVQPSMTACDRSRSSVTFDSSL